MVLASASGRASIGELSVEEAASRTAITSFGDFLAKRDGGWVTAPWGRGTVGGLVSKKKVRRE